jgi:4-hydroxy-tetrahydrodipicolinate synthase
MYAFFNSDGTLDLEAMKLQVNRCIEAGAQGIVVLGIVTEVNKLNVNERRKIVEWVGETVNGRVPYAVTCAEPSISGQVEFANIAKQNGADFVILQPPPVKGVAEIEYVRFFGTIAGMCEMPVAIQNNPVNLDVSLSNESLIRLGRDHENITILKAEGPAENVARLIDNVGDHFDLFSGRGGLELITTLLSGCTGSIPAPDVFDVELRIFDFFQKGGEDNFAEADRLYKEILPLIVFMSQSVTYTLSYGKYLTARRLGLKNTDLRPPALQTTEFGRKMIDRMTKDLGLFGEMKGNLAL